MTIRIAAALAGVFVLAACGGQTKPAADASPSPVQPASTEVVASPEPAPAMGEKPDRDFVIGKWGTDGDCELAVDLRADGSSDGPFGDWSYSDGVITFADAPDFKVAVTVVDDATMESTNGQGKTSTMTRCP